MARLAAPDLFALRYQLERKTFTRTSPRRPHDGGWFMSGVHVQSTWSMSKMIFSAKSDGRQYPAAHSEQERSSW